MNKKFTALLAATGALVSMALPNAAHAVACVAVVTTDGVNTTACDNGAGDLAPGVTGLINLLWNDTNWGFAVEIGYSKPVVGSATSPQLDLQYAVNALAGAVGQTAYIFLWDTDFIGGILSTGSLLLNGNSASGASVQALAGTNLGNNPANYNDFNAVYISQIVSGNSHQIIDSFNFATDNLYALALQLRVSPTVAGITTGDLNLKVPEPASLALLGLGLIGLGMSRRRKN